MNASDAKRLPIGVFDSGVGGLTVLKALQEALPNENLIYLGDTARLPYGTKSPTSISRYACQAARQLQLRDIKLLVVACNAIRSCRRTVPGHRLERRRRDDCRLVR
jgi:glutamate racemase